MRRRRTMRWMAVIMMMRLMIISIRRSTSRRAAMRCEGDGRDEGGVINLNGMG